MMKNLNGRAHNACYHPYYQQQLQQQQQQQQHLQQQQLLQQQQQQLQLPYAAQYNQLQQQQQQQQYNQQQYYNQQLQQQQQQQLLRQQQQQQQQPTQSAYQQQQQLAKQSYGQSNSIMAMHAATVATVNANGNSNANAANANTATAAMAAMCQMQSFLSQQQQQQQQQQQLQQQQQFNNNCAHINYNQQQEQQQQQQQLPATTAAAAATTTTNGDKLALDSASEIANFLASELFMHQLVTFDGMQSAPTLTTPTLTPTTLRTIEETMFELMSEPQNVPYQAGFKPPPLTSLGNVTNNNNNSNNSNNNNNTVSPTTTGGTLSVVNSMPINANPQFELLGLNCGSAPGSDSEDSNASMYDGQLNDDQSTTDTSSAATDSTSYQNGGHMLNNGINGGANNFTSALAAVSSAGRGTGLGNSSTSNSATPVRRGGGRRPNKSANMSPEEEEKRRVRRERNKLAAARCRKRRVDQTNELTEEVNALLKKAEDMKKEMESLEAIKQQLEYVLQAHTCQKVTCNGQFASSVPMLSDAGTCNGIVSHHSNNNNNNSNNSNNNNNSNSNDSSSGTITGFDATLNSTGRSNSPFDLKPVLTNEQLLQHIKDEPHDGGLDSGSSQDQDGPPPAKRFALPNIQQLNASLTTPTGPSGSLNTPNVGTAPSDFAVFANSNGGINSPTLNAHALNKQPKARPNTLPFLQPHIEGKVPSHGVAIQTPSAGTFNYDSLMSGGTGLTPVLGPLVPNKQADPAADAAAEELPTPTSEPSKLFRL